jgi:hypothetical protein
MYSVESLIPSIQAGGATASPALCTSTSISCSSPYHMERIVTWKCLLAIPRVIKQDDEIWKNKNDGGV